MTLCDAAISDSISCACAKEFSSRGNMAFQWKRPSLPKDNDFTFQWNRPPSPFRNVVAIEASVAQRVDHSSRSRSPRRKYTTVETTLHARASLEMVGPRAAATSSCALKETASIESEQRRCPPLLATVPKAAPRTVSTSFAKAPAFPPPCHLRLFDSDFLVWHF